MKKFRKAVSLITSLLLAGAMTACSSTPTATTEGTTAGTTNGQTAGATTAAEEKTDTTAAESDPIKIAVVAWNPCMFMSLAEELGYFEQAGVNVELVDFASYSDVPTAFNSGELDGAFFSSFEVIAPYSLGVDIDVVAIVDNSIGADALVASADYPDIESLKGKSIGVGIDTISHIYLMLLLEQNGYNIDDFNLVNLGATEVAPALVSGQIEAATTFEPFVSIITGSGDGAHIITDTSETPDLINDCLAFSGKVCEERGDELAKVMECWYDAMDYYDKNQEEAAAIMAGKLDTSPEDFIATMSKLDMQTAQKSTDLLKSAEWTANMNSIRDFLIQRGLVENEVDMAGVINTKIVEDSMKIE